MDCFVRFQMCIDTVIQRREGSRPSLRLPDAGLGSVTEGKNVSHIHKEEFPHGIPTAPNKMLWWVVADLYLFQYQFETPPQAQRMRDQWIQPSPTSQKTQRKSASHLLVVSAGCHWVSRAGQYRGHCNDQCSSYALLQFLLQLASN